MRNLLLHGATCAILQSITMKKNRPLIIFVSLVALVIALALTSVYFYKKYNRLNLGSSQASGEEVRALVAELDRIMVLPENETPTVATVTDPQKLSGQEFFIDAKIGDKVIIYAVAKKAILYDPTARKIVNIAPISLDSGAKGTTPAGR